MIVSAQAKVLRVLQSGEFNRVGGEQTLKADVRVVAATNRDLQAAVAAGQFREDLYFRLNVVPLRAPALRERAEDVPLLAQSFVEQICRENGMKPKTISPEAVALLSAYPWPGNVRELRNVIERLVILSDEGIGVGDLPEEIVAEANRQARPVSPGDREHGRAAARGAFVTAARIPRSHGATVHPGQAGRERLEHLAHRGGPGHRADQLAQEDAGLGSVPGRIPRPRRRAKPEALGGSEPRRGRSGNRLKSAVSHRSGRASAFRGTDRV